MRAYGRPEPPARAPLRCVDCGRGLRESGLGESRLVWAVYGAPLDWAARCPKCFRAGLAGAPVVPDGVDRDLGGALGEAAAAALAGARAQCHHLPAPWRVSASQAMSRCRLCLAQFVVGVQTKRHEYISSGVALGLRCPSKLAR